MKERPPRPFQVLIRHDAGPPLSKCAAWLRQVSDRSRPALGRIEAVESLAKECLESQIFHNLAQLVDDESDDITVRSAIVLALPRWGDAPSQVFAIVRALSLPGVRPAALEALDRIGQATGVRESRLLAELEGLRNGFADPSRVSALLKMYGRDRRVLNYLGQRLQNGNRWERALAASALLGLGEIETALRAALDPEARVRNSLAAAIGWYREPEGLQVLERLANDTDSDVTIQAMSSLRRLRGVDVVPPSTEFDWVPLLKELSEFRLSDPRVAAGVPNQSVEEGWLGERGATENQIRLMEQRLGQSMPRSYRSFLAASNGFWLHHSSIKRLYGTNDVDWFGVRHRAWADAYREMYPHLASCLQISEVVGDGAVLLLEPDAGSSDVEWNTYHFANWIPGAIIYGSFREFMEEELNECCEWRNRSKQQPNRIIRRGSSNRLNSGA